VRRPLAPYGTRCQHTIDLYDSYGDGWNGNTLDGDGDLVLSGITLPADFGPLTFSFTAANGNRIHTVYHAIGQYPEEPYYQLFDGLGLFIVQDGGAYIQPTGITVVGNCDVP
jgi:hypothetical protein